MLCAGICSNKKAQNIGIFETKTFECVLWCFIQIVGPIDYFDTTHIYHIKHSIFGVLVKCAGVGVAKFSENTHVWCGSVWSEKL